MTQITPERHGIDRPCTMMFAGAGFTPATVVEFVGSDAGVRAPSELRVLAATTMVAVLDTPSWPEDVYDVIVSRPGAVPWEAGDALTVSAGTASFEAHLIIPGDMDRLWRRTIWIEYANTGDSSMGAPLLTCCPSHNDVTHCWINGWSNSLLPLCGQSPQKEKRYESVRERSLL